MSEPQRIVEGILRENDILTVKERESIGVGAVRNDLPRKAASQASVSVTDRYQDGC